MKIVFTSLLAFSCLTASASPVKDAYCAAVLKAAETFVQKDNPRLAARLATTSDSIYKRAEHVLGPKAASGYYVYRLDRITDTFLASQGRSGIPPGELSECLRLAQSYGL